MVFLLLAFISSIAIDKIIELLKGNIKSEFKTKLKTDRLLLCSFIGLIFFVVFIILAYVLRIF